jgi:glycosyltransferase involved in cell wall biosynthesis
MVPQVNGTAVLSEPTLSGDTLAAMRVVMLTHYWAPEVGAPQTRLAETARHLVAMGDEVRVITSHPHYPDGIVRSGYGPLTIRRETMDGIPVLRMPVLARPNSGFVNRIIDQASFAFSAAAAIEDVRWADVMLVESPPLFLGLTAPWLSRVAHRPYVLHVADPWPDYPIEVGALRGAFPIAIARRIERTAYEDASAITTPTEGCARLIREQPGSAGKVRVVPNGVDINRFHPTKSTSNARAELGWDQEPFTFVYCGSVGLAQGLSTLLDAAVQLGNSPHCSPHVIHIVGGGVERDRLKVEALRSGLRNVVFHTPVAASLVPTLLAAADAALVLLRRGRLAEAALPTKFVEALAAGRPVVASADGDVRELVAEGNAGWAVPAEDAAALAQIMARAMNDPGLGERAAAARRLAVAKFSRAATANLTRAVLRSVSP